MLRALPIILLMALATPASAHDVFTDLQTPHGGLCCTGPSQPGRDCERVPAKWVPQVIREVPGRGWRITLTVAQAKFFNKTSIFPIDQVVPYNEVIGGLASGWGLCVLHEQVRCLVGPSNT